MIVLFTLLIPMIVLFTLLIPMVVLFTLLIPGESFVYIVDSR